MSEEKKGVDLAGTVSNQPSSYLSMKNRTVNKCFDVAAELVRRITERTSDPHTLASSVNVSCTYGSAQVSIGDVCVWDSETDSNGPDVQACLDLYRDIMVQQLTSIDDCSITRKISTPSLPPLPFGKFYVIVSVDPTGVASFDMYPARPDGDRVIVLAGDTESMRLLVRRGSTLYRVRDGWYADAVWHVHFPTSMPGSARRTANPELIRIPPVRRAGIECTIREGLVEWYGPAGTTPRLTREVPGAFS